MSDSRSQDAGSPAYRYVADQIGGRELALILGGLMMLGVVTSLLQFSRSVGLTIGTVISGSILTLRFAPEVRSALGAGLLVALFMPEVPLLGRGQVGTASAPAPSPSPDLARSGRTGSPPALTA